MYHLRNCLKREAAQVMRSLTTITTWLRDLLRRDMKIRDLLLRDTFSPYWNYQL